MIALRDNLPFIRLPDGESVLLNPPTLERSIALAAEKAHYPQWWLAEHISSAIVQYLQKERAGTVLDLEDLVRSVRTVLQVTGYPEVAPHFRLETSAAISLLEVAQSAGAGYELAFFNQLRAQMLDALRLSRDRITLVDLEPCVKQIRCRKVWSRDCEALQLEIVRFAQEQILAIDPESPILLTLHQ
jgi:hypothetical protein